MEEWAGIWGVKINFLGIGRIFLENINGISGFSALFWRVFG